MSWFKGIKRNATDALFSDIVRERLGYVCERCHRDFKSMTSIFDTSHFITRGNKRTRWDFQNVLGLCRGCHGFFSKNPIEHYEFMRNKLGEHELNLLRVRSTRKMSDAKIDEKSIRLGLKLEWKRMKDEEKKKIIGAR